ncbi:MAG: hypothetical protein CMJ49_00360 [Planctomycetaceae bacterium]|nr:hypothetical protein [Planctomycetaceae bacterium]
MRLLPKSKQEKNVFWTIFLVVFIAGLFVATYDLYIGDRYVGVGRVFLSYFGVFALFEGAWGVSLLSLVVVVIHLAVCLTLSLLGCFVCRKMFARKEDVTKP